MKKNILLQSLLTTLLLLGLAQAYAAPREALFNGKDLTNNWTSIGEWMLAKSVALDPANPEKFVITPGQGIMVNGPKGRTGNILSKTEFGDIELHIEFCIPKKSNSGIYLMGRYEVQVYDSFGVEKDQYPGIECGGLYPRWINDKNVEGHSPRVNVSKAPGTWQTFDIIFRAPKFDPAGKKVANAKFIQVKFNGAIIHQMIELNGPTRAAMSEDEKPLGPILLQGDHGPVAYRNVLVRKLTLK